MFLQGSWNYNLMGVRLDPNMRWAGPLQPSEALPRGQATSWTLPVSRRVGTRWEPRERGHVWLNQGQVLHLMSIIVCRFFTLCLIWSSWLLLIMELNNDWIVIDVYTLHTNLRVGWINKVLCNTTKSFISLVRAECRWLCCSLGHYANFKPRTHFRFL